MKQKIYKRKRIIPVGWKEIKLGDVFRTSSGSTPLSTEKSYYEGGVIPWINSGELASPYIYETSNYITQKGFENSSTELYPKDTVLVAMYGATAGKASLLKLEACTNQAICAILPNEGYCPEFIKYNIDTLYEHLVGLSSGSARDNLSQAGLKELKLVLPKTKKEQEKLVSVLSLLDRKIELNRQINDNLEAMAKQLYDYWFVQFDFPNEEGKPYKSSGGAMVWNEKLKREIPKGWSVKNLEQIATSYQQGLIRSNNQLSTDSKYGYLKMGDLDGKGQYTLQGLTRTNATNEEVDLFSLHKGDFLINVRNSKEIVGKTCLIGYVERNTLYNHMLVRLDFKDVSTFYMNLLFNSEFMYKALDGLKQGTTTVIALYQNDLYRLPILVPAPCVMEQFSKITDSILDQKEIISYEIEELTKQRDDLLPLLMNGQATVNYHLFVMQSRLSSYRRLHPFYVLLYTFCVSV